MDPKTIADLAQSALTDEEHSPEYWKDPVWVDVVNFDGTQDLYQVVGFRQHTCQPTLELKHVERVYP